MFRALERWVNDLEDREETLEALTKVRSLIGFRTACRGQGLTPSLQESVRSGKNKRKGSEDDNTSGTEGGAYSQSQNSQSQKPYRSGVQPVAGSTYASSQSGGYGRQEASHKQGLPASSGSFVCV
jgi:hypothetical protein